MSDVSVDGLEQPFIVPSYDDLTPGIPDVLASQSVSQLALFLREDLNMTENSGFPASHF